MAENRPKIVTRFETFWWKTRYAERLSLKNRPYGYGTREGLTIFAVRRVVIPSVTLTGNSIDFSGLEVDTLVNGMEDGAWRVNHLTGPG